MLAIAVAGKVALLGHYRGTEPMSKTLFLSASIAFSRLGHKAMFTGLSATPYRRGPVVEGRIFWDDERTVVCSEAAEQGCGGARGGRSEEGVIFP